MRRIIALLLALAATSPVLARDELPVIPQPIILRLVGHFAPDHEKARAGSADAVLIRVGDVERWFAVDRARTLGDHALDGRDVLALLAPFRPQLIAVGTDDLRTRLREAPVDTPVQVEGLVNRGSRTYLLREVVAGAAPGS